MILRWEPYRRVRIMTAKELGCSKGGTKKVDSQQW